MTLTMNGTDIINAALPQVRVGPSDTEVELAYALNDVRNLSHNNQKVIEDFVRFQHRVRDEAIEVRAEMGWCLQGLNEHLRNLNLEPYCEEFTAEVTVTFSVTVRDSNGSGLDEDTVENWLDREFRSDRWCIDDNDIEVNHIADVSIADICGEG